MISWFTTWTIFHRETSHFPPWNQPFEVLFGRTSLGPFRASAEPKIVENPPRYCCSPGVLQGPFDFRPWLGEFGQGQTLAKTLVGPTGAFKKKVSWVWVKNAWVINGNTPFWCMLVICFFKFESYPPDPSNSHGSHGNHGSVNIVLLYAWRGNHPFLGGQRFWQLHSCLGRQVRGVSCQHSHCSGFCCAQRLGTDRLNVNKMGGDRLSSSEWIEQRSYGIYGHPYSQIGEPVGVTIRVSQPHESRNNVVNLYQNGKKKQHRAVQVVIYLKW